MKRPSSTKSFAAAIAAMCMVTSSIASAATTPVRTLDPLVALSIFGTAQSSAALCATGAAAVVAGAAQAAPAPGCVLPVGDAAPPPVVTEVAPPPPYVAEPVAASGGFGFLPLLLVLGAVAAAVFLLDNDDDGTIRITVPNSPT